MNPNIDILTIVLKHKLSKHHESINLPSDISKIIIDSVVVKGSMRDTANNRVWVHYEKSTRFGNGEGYAMKTDEMAIGFDEIISLNRELKLNELIGKDGSS